MSEPKFKVGDRVLLSPAGTMLYGSGPANGGGKAGTVFANEPRKNDASRPYIVVWDSLPQEPNSYREIDLELSRFMLVQP